MANAIATIECFYNPIEGDPGWEVQELDKDGGTVSFITYSFDPNAAWLRAVNEAYIIGVPAIRRDEKGSTVETYDPLINRFKKEG